MSGARTEAPTPRRLREARRRGEVATSRELTGAFAVLAGVAAMTLCGRGIAASLAAAMRHDLAAAVGAGADPWPAVVGALALLARTALPPLAAAAVGAAAAGALQTGGLFTLAAVRFRLEDLDPARGLARLASPERLRAVGFALVKSAMALGTAWAFVRGGAPAIAAAPSRLAGATLQEGAASAACAAVGVGVALAALGIADLLLARRTLLQRQRMTREEVARERREEEGDPRIVALRRRVHRALASAAPLRRATCLVVNPTHVAVALEHRAGGDDAPQVLAKGVADAAARLRTAARRAGVPIVEDVALARALYRLADVGDAIPEELYDAVAAVLVHLHRASGELAP
ncbi:MAG: EscU/YscU/HrcU family type III secretion system export apparatus switch protein [Anaeromyxobacteraceae bacterium]